jgi:hypothetical protein
VSSWSWNWTTSSTLRPSSTRAGDHGRSFLRGRAAADAVAQSRWLEEVRHRLRYIKGMRRWFRLHCRRWEGSSVGKFGRWSSEVGNGNGGSNHDMYLFVVSWEPSLVSA